MSQRLFLLLQDSERLVTKTAFQHYDCLAPNPLGIWIIASLAVILIGFIFVRAINHKEVKTDWSTFFTIYGALCLASLILYIVIHD